MSKRWFVVHAYSGYEKESQSSIWKKELSLNQCSKIMFGEVLVPTEEVVEMRQGGQKRKSERKFFPRLCAGADGVE